MTTQAALYPTEDFTFTVNELLQFSKICIDNIAFEQPPEEVYNSLVTGISNELSHMDHHSIVSINEQVDEIIDNNRFDLGVFNRYGLETFYDGVIYHKSDVEKLHYRRLFELFAMSRVINKYRLL